MSFSFSAVRISLHSDIMPRYKSFGSLNLLFKWGDVKDAGQSDQEKDYRYFKTCLTMEENQYRLCCHTA